MPAESTEALLRSLTGASGESAVEVYGKWAVLSIGNDDSLYRLVNRKLVANGKSAQVKESLEATLRAGGAVGESVEECLLKSGLTGWS